MMRSRPGTGRLNKAGLLAAARSVLPPHPHLSRLGVGLLVIGTTEVTHHLWGLAVDLPLLIAGGVGLAWALVARHAQGMVAGIVLLAVALFALLDDKQVFGHPQDAMALATLAGLLVIAHGIPASWRDAWPIVPAGVLLLIGVFALIRLATPWSWGGPVLVLLVGLTFLAWDGRGGHVP
jgi:hypothetical protein